MPTRRALLGTAAGVATVTAGCVGNRGNGDGGDDASGDGAEGGEATVEVRSTDEYGDVLVDGDGMTLYVFDEDEQGAGESACTGGCADTWPPLTGGTASAGDGVDVELTTFEREDGSSQVAAEGRPLYGYSGDDGPGDTNGQGVGGTWWVVEPSGSPVETEATPTPGGGGDDDGGDDDIQY